MPKTIYICGPTVYDSSHLGHVRTYLMIDLMLRTMEDLFNQKLLVVMNITNIDDKIIKKAEECKQSWLEISEQYEKSFFMSMQKLNIKLPHVIIRVSEVIPSIVSYIQTIIDKGFGYMHPDGSVYFDTNYYEKSGYTIDHPTEETNEETNNKKNQKDFALWKGRTKDEIGFDVEFQYEGNVVLSRGRPGWHIECSAMIHETIGSDLDVHFGGIDLKFPHHHNEKLQANAFYHPKFFGHNKWPKEFIHIGHLHIKGQKMSKSLKNFTTIDEVLQNLNPNQMRWMFISNKWSEPMEFDEEAVSHAKSYDRIIHNFFGTVANYPFELLNTKMNEKEKILEKEFHHSQKIIMDQLEKFEFHPALCSIFELISKTYTYIEKEKINQRLVKQIQSWLEELLIKLGFDYNETRPNNEKEIMNILISTRSQFRKLTRDKMISKEIKQKIFEILDNERDIGLRKIGIALKDTKDSSLWN